MMFKLKFVASVILVASAYVSASTFAGTLPLKPLPDDNERYFWWYHQVQTDKVLEDMQKVVAAPAIPFNKKLKAPVKIAVIYPSQDVSDYYLRSYLAMEARFKEMGIKTESVQFASKIGEYLLQATYAERVARDDFDYVVYAPSDLNTQQDDVKLLMDSGKKVIVFNFDTPVQEWGDKQPMMYTAFSHLAGALNICKWVVENLGKEGTYAMIRGLPGFIDNQRSGGFEECMKENSNWKMAYEHYGNFKREGGFAGTELVTAGYPEVTYIHNGSTAMAMGSIAALQGAGLQDKIKVSAWGGTGEELVALRKGELMATPMRMTDDVGVSIAEAIRADLEGRAKDLPLVFLGRINILSSNSGPELVDQFEQEAFRYTGIGTLER